MDVYSPRQYLFEQSLYYAHEHYDTFCVLHSNGYRDAYSRYETLIALGNVQEAQTWESWQELPAEWQFGFFGYDLKNKLESLSSAHPDRVDFPELFFFIPETVLKIEHGQLSVLHSNKDAESIRSAIHSTVIPAKASKPISLQQRISREEYLKKIRQVQAHIQRGDVYELNFCMEFFAEEADIHPIETYLRLNQLSPTPFSGYLQFGGKSILCASPERYLQQNGNTIISQPIKGTAARNTDSIIDEANKEALRSNPKEQAENVMIVDLVRNDLSRFAERNSVTVAELMGMYSFPQWHQMISTIACTVDPSIDSSTIIRNSFPMGSMTGAPKISAMQLIERYEESRRSAYSGALGYSEPSGNFDLNVIIRSILYDAKSKQLSFQVGSAITAEAVPEAEYEECLLKAKAMMRVLQQA